MEYPESEFLRDFGQWHAYPVGKGDQRAAAVFPILYPDREICSYRFNRLRCVVAAIQNNVEQLVHDGMMRPEKLPGRTTVHLPNRLLCALHTYYGGVDEKLLDSVPPPDWATVLKIYDELKDT